MLEEALKKCRGSAKKAIIIALVVIVLAMVAPKLAPISFILGPKDLTGETNLDYADYEGKYVSIDIEYVFDYYLESYSVNTDTNAKRLTSYGYVVYNWDDDSCFAVELSSKQDDKMNKLMDQTVDYYNYGTVPTEKITVKGTIKELKGQKLTYYKESVEGLGEVLTGIEDVAVAYVLDSSEVNGISNGFVFMAYIAAGIALLIMVYYIFRYVTGGMKSKLNKFLSTHQDITEEQIDADMISAAKIGKNVWAGKKYTVYIQGIYLNIIENKNLVWAYYYRRTGRNAVSQVRTYNKDHKMVVINMSNSLADELLKLYSETQPHIVVGYTKEVEKQYNKDFAGFLNLQYNPAQSLASTDDYNRFYETSDGDSSYTNRENDNQSYTQEENKDK